MINAGTPASVQIETGNIVGYIRSRQHGFAVQVTSRFGELFLCHMISSSEGFLALDDLSTGTEEGLAEWLLVYLWKVRLRQAFAAGVPKMYVRRNMQTALLRGSLDLSLCLEVPSQTGRYPCRYSEHAFDNPITRLIHTTFDAISKRENISGIIADAHRLRQAFAEANGGLRILRPNEYKAGTVRNPYFEAYNGVADLSRKILAQQTAELGLDETDFDGFLFDISLLFEHYIRTLLRNAGLDLEPKMAAVRYPTGGRRRGLIPDIVLSGPRGTLILDVKYKHWRPEGVTREDSFQIMSYVAAYRGRYEAEHPVIGYGFVFPVTEQPSRAFIEEDFPEIGVRFYVFFILIPRGEATGPAFENGIRVNEAVLARQIGTLLGHP